MSVYRRLAVNSIEKQVKKTNTNLQIYFPEGGNKLSDVRKIIVFIRSGVRLNSFNKENRSNIYGWKKYNGAFRSVYFFWE